MQVENDDFTLIVWVKYFYRTYMIFYATHSSFIEYIFLS
jgi:hypothetical protein